VVPTVHSRVACSAFSEVLSFLTSTLVGIPSLGHVYSRDGPAIRSKTGSPNGYPACSQFSAGHMSNLEPRQLLALAAGLVTKRRALAREPILIRCRYRYSESDDSNDTKKTNCRI